MPLGLPGNDVGVPVHVRVRGDVAHRACCKLHRIDEILVLHDLCKPDLDFCRRICRVLCEDRIGIAAEPAREERLVLLNTHVGIRGRIRQPGPRSPSPRSSGTPLQFPTASTGQRPAPGTAARGSPSTGSPARSQQPRLPGFP